MALKLISRHSTPNFIAESTDIDINNKISGASIIGGTVFLLDTAQWKLINSDLELVDYALPIDLALSGEVTVGAVEIKDKNTTDKARVDTNGNFYTKTILTDSSGNDYDNVNPVIIAESEYFKDAFSRSRVSLPRTIFDSSFYYDLQPVIFETVVANNGTVTHAPTVAGALLTATATSNSSAIITSREHHKYTPAKSQFIAMTQIFGPSVNGVVKRAGYYNQNNGIFFEQNGTTDIAFVVRTNTSGSPSDTSRVVQDDWNIDKLDGTGASGIDLDLTKAQILVIDFQWLGMGRVRVGWDIDGKIIYCHQFLHSNILSTPYMRTPTLPVRWEITANGVTAGSTMYANCCSVSSEGGIDEPMAFTYSASNPSSISATTSRTPLIAIRPKALFNSIVNRIKIVPLDFSVVAGNNPIQLELIYNPTTLSVTGGWTSADTNSSVEYHTVFTAISGGTPISSIFVPSSNAVRGQGFSKITARLPLTLDSSGANPIPLVLCAKSLVNTSDCRGSISWEELR